MIYVIKKPILTEKSTMNAESGVYSFEVDRKATKIDIKTAVEKSFSVKVTSVNTVVCRGKVNRNKFGLVKPKYWKKAMVKLAPGEKISIFEGV